MSYNLQKMKYFFMTKFLIFFFFKYLFEAYQIFCTYDVMHDHTFLHKYLCSKLFEANVKWMKIMFKSGGLHADLIMVFDLTIPKMNPEFLDDLTQELVAAWNNFSHAFVREMLHTSNIVATL